MDALRILFPLNREYLKVDKQIFEQLKELLEKPYDYTEKCLALLHFKSQNINHDEAVWIMNTVDQTKKPMEKEKISSGHKIRHYPEVE